MLKQLAKYISVCSVIALVFQLGGVVSSALNAEEETIVRQNCISAQVSLQRTQYSDAANRVKRGQAYETLLSKFMLTLNSRTASNGLSAEAAKLSEITERYQQSLDTFKGNYDTYADSLEALIRMKCKNDPKKFYDHVQSTRENRTKLSTDIAELDRVIEEYRVAVNQVKRSVED